jgi:hypothetical protein
MSPDGPPFQPGLNNPTRSAYESEAMTPALDEYAAWKATAAAELERLHEVRAATIPDRVWKRLYVAGLGPQEAAQEAEVHHFNTRSPADRLRRLPTPRERLHATMIEKKKPPAPSVGRGYRRSR